MLQGAMDPMFSATQLQALRDYSAGRAGTRETIERAGLDDYADLIVALARNGLDLPRDAAPSPERDARRARLSAILQPLLRHDD